MAKENTMQKACVHLATTNMEGRGLQTFVGMLISAISHAAFVTHVITPATTNIKENRKTLRIRSNLDLKGDSVINLKNLNFVHLLS